MAQNAVEGLIPIAPTPERSVFWRLLLTRDVNFHDDIAAAVSGMLEYTVKTHHAFSRKR